MKPYLEQIYATNQNSFLCRSFLLHHFDSKFHFHPEYELTYIEKSCGKRFVGQHMGSFEPGDLVLVGKEVPHCWLNEKNISDTHEASSLVIQFREDFLGEQWLHAPEFNSVMRMLRLAARGIKFDNESAKQIAPLMRDLLSFDPFHKLIRFLELLQILSNIENFTLLNEQHNLILSEEDCNRIQVVFDFVRLNFTEEIRLEKVAEMMYMTPTSFCRYFKKITRKSFSRFLIEYRMEYARSRLLHTDKSITSICYESGFRNIAHFNQQFKILNQTSPREYRKLFTDTTIFS